MYYYCNNEFYAHDKLISCKDRGFLLGDGVFETIRCYKQCPLYLPEHLQRLAKGLQALDIPYELNFALIKKNLVLLLQKNSLIRCEASVRITITRGAGSRGLDVVNSNHPTLLMTAEKYCANPKPLNLKVSHYKINETSPFCHHKVINYLDRIMARKNAVAEGFDDAILCNTKKEIVSSSCANIFIVFKKELHTPALDCGVLPGVTRNTLLYLAQKHHIKIYKRCLFVEEIAAAQEVFICNSLIGIQSVCGIHPFFQSKRENTLTQFLNKQYQQYTLQIHK